MTTPVRRARLLLVPLVLTALAATGCSTKKASDSGGGNASKATVAFLMPDQASTRYEQHDIPGFKAEMKKLCPGCKVIYQNADADAAKQQQQFNSVISQGAKVDRARPGRLDGRRLAGQAGAEPGRQGHRLRPADPRRPRPTTTSPSTTKAIGKAIAESLVEHLKATKVPPGDGRRAADQRLADRRGGGPDQEGHPRRPRHQRLQDAGRVRHAGLGAAEGAAVGQRPDHPLRQEDRRRRRRQ